MNTDIKQTFILRLFKFSTQVLMHYSVKIYDPIENIPNWFEDFNSKISHLKNLQPRVRRILGTSFTKSNHKCLFVSRRKGEKHVKNLKFKLEKPLKIGHE